MINNLVQFHTDIFFAVHELTELSPIFNQWLVIIAEDIDMYIVAIGVIFILLHHHRRVGNEPEFISHQSIKEGLIIIMGVLVAWGISYLMKIGFAIPRPFLQFPEITPLFQYGGYNSFPSGHATLFAALATGIYMNHKKIGLIFAVIAICISLARVIAGVHFPIDILVGWGLGITTVLLVSSSLRKYR